MVIHQHRDLLILTQIDHQDRPIRRPHRRNTSIRLFLQGQLATNVLLDGHYWDTAYPTRENVA
jgi:hypothetical protein